MKRRPTPFNELIGKQPRVASEIPPQRSAALSYIITSLRTMLDAHILTGAPVAGKSESTSSPVHLSCVHACSGILARNETVQAALSQASNISSDGFRRVVAGLSCWGEGGGE